MGTGETSPRVAKGPGDGGSGRCRWRVKIWDIGSKPDSSFQFMMPVDMGHFQRGTRDFDTKSVYFGVFSKKFPLRGRIFPLLVPKSTFGVGSGGHSEKVEKSGINTPPPWVKRDFRP